MFGRFKRKESGFKPLREDFVLMQDDMQQEDKTMSNKTLMPGMPISHFCDVPIAELQNKKWLVQNTNSFNFKPCTLVAMAAKQVCVFVLPGERDGHLAVSDWDYVCEDLTPTRRKIWVAIETNGVLVNRCIFDDEVSARDFIASSKAMKTEVVAFEEVLP